MSKHHLGHAVPLGAPVDGSCRTAQELTVEELWLLQAMREHQFGRIELLPIRDGRPRPGPDTKIVRVARLGGEGDAARPNRDGNFELTQAARDLFTELSRLQNCLVLRLEFRFGQPCLVETEARLVNMPSSDSVASST